MPTDKPPGEASTTDPAFTVWWDSASENPLTWSPAKKWTNIMTVSAFSFLVPFASTMITPAVKEVTTDLHDPSATFATFVVSIFVLGFATGPLLLSPLSELYGRVPVYHAAHVLFVISTVLCAEATTPAMMLAARALSGFFGVATITIGSGTIADLMPREKRGRAVSIWAVGTIFGPMIGPITGGSVAHVAGWRWVFWVFAMMLAAVTLVSWALLRETYAPVLLERKAARRRAETGDPRWRSGLASAEDNSETTTTTTTTRRARVFWTAILRPTRMLLCCPIVTIMCSYAAVLYGMLYLLFSTYSYVFKEVYAFSTLEAGLVFLPSGVGTLGGLWFIGYLSDRTLMQRAKENGGLNAPEDRLPLAIMMPGALAYPAGLFLYGWSIEYRVHWAVPLLGTAVAGFGSWVLFIGVTTYLIDAFDQHAASVTAANAVLRGMAGALVPMGGLHMYHAMGLGWGNSLLGFVTLAMAPVPWLFGVYGARIRTRPGFQVRL